MPPKKYFSIDEANSFVPSLLKDIPKIQKLGAQLDSEFPDVKKAREKAQYNGGSKDGVDYLRIALLFNKMVNDLESKGIILKGISEGLVDFPSVRDGREVYLCWKVPEKKIEYWHDPQAGFAGRKPI